MQEPFVALQWQDRDCPRIPCNLRGGSDQWPRLHSPLETTTGKVCAAKRFICREIAGVMHNNRWRITVALAAVFRNQINHGR